MDIKNKTILITGAKRIGRDVAIALARRGANLAIAYNSSKEEAESLVNQIKDTGVRSMLIKADISKQSDIKNLVESVTHEFGKIDGLVHMAAPYPKTPLGQINETAIAAIFSAIAGSAILLGQEVGLPMKDRGGKIIFFSDWSVLRSPFPDYLVYNAAKAAIDSITKTLARELAPKITVNAIAPGPILMPPGLTEDENREVLAKTPLGKWGGAEEIVKAVLYLLDSDFTTGVVLPVDGGRSIA